MQTLASKVMKLRLVEEADAQYIHSLRMDSRLGKFLSKTVPDVSAQCAWISEYKKREKRKEEFYYVVETLEGKACGTIRLYNIIGDTFVCGSWILSGEYPVSAPIESLGLIYQLGFEKLGLKCCLLDVRKKNERVLKIHTGLGALITGEDELNYYLKFSHEAYRSMKQKFKNLLW